MPGARSIEVFHNRAVPPLPLERDSLNLVYAFSVFSHIDEQEMPWLEELRRVLRPGGYAYLSTHTEHTWGILGSEHAIYRNLFSLPFRAAPAMVIEPAMLTRPMPAERVVFSLPGARAYGRNVFQSTAYIEREWGRLFEIQAIHRQGAYYQDVIVLRKRAG
ncbi:MAG: class I SAM-dependent methyltransferase [Phycisphaerales bacterium]|nr:class I SAM-dependent methyltransferase [Phycisphaerales bacterium]